MGKPFPHQQNLFCAMYTVNYVIYIAVQWLTNICEHAENHMASDETHTKYS